MQALAAPGLDGRLAGSNGEKLASDYIVSELKKLDARPLPGRSDFLMPFAFTAGTKDGGSTISIAAQGAGAAGQAGKSGQNGVPTRFDTQADVRALSFSDNAEVSGDVVFAGYGIVVPESQNFGYDSYTTLDVKDKIVLVLRYFPEDADQKTRGILARYADLRYKAMAARQRGARAMLVVTGPRSPNAGETIPMSFDTALAGSGIVAASISANVARALLAALPGEKALDAIQKSFDSGNPHVTGYAVPGAVVTLRAAVQREQRTAHNVLAYLPATAPEAGVENKPWVAIGAHYDHLGHGEAGNTLAAKEDLNKTHAGADDNASGSAAVLAMATDLAHQPRRRNVLVAFWSGEELGLLGSAAFAAAPAVPMDQIAAYLNFDMVGRMQDNKLTVQATGTSPTWAKVLEQANVTAGFDLQVQEDPYQPTDVATFNAASVPCLSFFTGTHTDYHKPSDTADKIDYDDLDRVADFGAAIVRRISDTGAAPQFTKVDQQMQGGGGRAGVRVFTGTIPDYGGDVKGLLLSGVIGGGPAEQAGLRKGDVIVEIAGQTIANIYDYTYALDVLKIGEPAKVIYIRDGKRIETMLTPAARK
ncbi:MAG TPA: M20/M25/M40 family metallo-hydrolase [Vicinamibacterales bacterium]